MRKTLEITVGDEVHALGTASDLEYARTGKYFIVQSTKVFSPGKRFTSRLDFSVASEAVDEFCVRCRLGAEESVHVRYLFSRFRQ
jgi:hypothetical protein